jgi:DNA-binding transcriptional MerR regulator
LSKPRKIITRRTVLRRLEIEGEVLDRLEELDLVVPVRRPGRERAYHLRDVDRLRVYQVLVQELGVNPPGAEIILRMRTQLLAMQDRMFRMLSEFKNKVLLDEMKQIVASLQDEPW